MRSCQLLKKSPKSNTFCRSEPTPKSTRCSLKLHRTQNAFAWLSPKPPRWIPMLQSRLSIKQSFFVPNHLREHLRQTNGEEIMTAAQHTSHPSRSDHHRYPPSTCAQPTPSAIVILALAPKRSTTPFTQKPQGSQICGCKSATKHRHRPVVAATSVSVRYTFANAHSASTRL